MADTLQILGGDKAAMPKLPERCPGWVKDEETLYMGTAAGNKKVGGPGVYTRLETLEKLPAKVTALESAMPGKLTATKAAAQADLPADADLAAFAAAHNGLLAALRAAGIMA